MSAFQIMRNFRTPQLKLATVLLFALAAAQAAAQTPAKPA
ncbi:MAG: hypothetical protein JWP34_3730, partial [Massilia sp.]|nr:hypothetical protein [Massilia sp.]